MEQVRATSTRRLAAKNERNTRMQILNNLGQALFMAVSMFWEILWPLILGFTLSGIVQAVVSHQAIAKALGGDSPKNLTLATLFGIASSSCSYAAVALARSIFQKGASFTASMAFELASTNLVIELGIILVVLMGWQFMAAEYLGGLLMVIVLAVVFRLTLTPRLVQQAKGQAEKGLEGRMEGHAAMDVWVPESFWQAFFLSNNPTLAKIEGPLVGPLVAIVSFVCSVGNVPLAAVLWRGGISFGGVVSFIFADLIILPILDIYRKYYGWKVMGYILVTFYVTMAAAGYVVEFLFAALGIIPENRNVVAITEGIQWNYTTVLNLLFLVLAAVLVFRFIRTGGVSMLRMMNRPEHDMHHHERSSSTNKE